MLRREELETEIADFEAAHQLLIALGYEVVFIYEKYRTVYTLAGVQVMLDELPFGSFVEIEGEPSGIHKAADQLQLNWQAAIPASYHALFQQLAAISKFPFRDLTFKNFKEHQISIEEIGIRPADEPPNPSR
jgi:adenylate cyclase class 2